MFATRRPKARIFLNGTVMLGAGLCAHAALAAQQAPMKGNYSLNTPVQTIAADARGKAILDRDLPGLTTNKSYALFEDMSLLQLAPLSNGRLSHASLARVQSDLTALSFQEASAQ